MPGPLPARAQLAVVEREQAHVALTRVNPVARNLDRWLFDTHGGAVAWEHLGPYLDELTFRFNRRRSDHGGGERAEAAFTELMSRALARAPVRRTDVRAPTVESRRPPPIASLPWAAAAEW